MKYLAAYLLAREGGNNEPKAEDIAKILASVGINPDYEKIEVIFQQMTGKDYSEIKNDGIKFASSQKYDSETLQESSPSKSIESPEKKDDYECPLSFEDLFA